MEPHSIYHYWRAMAAMAAGRGGTSPTVLELGANDGADAVRLAKTSMAPMHWVGLEPDPRNFPRLRERLAEYRHVFASTLAYQLAASNVSGTADLYLSGGETPGCGGRVHTDSSSLNAPTRHLTAHPWCTFDQTATVRTVPVDDLVAWVRDLGPAVRDRYGSAAPVGALGLGLANAIDLMWVDVQGAQRKVLKGAWRTLNTTRFLYIECHQEPLTEDEPTPQELVHMLPGWEEIARWPTDLLLLNTRFSATTSHA